MKLISGNSSVDLNQHIYVACVDVSKESIYSSGCPHLVSVILDIANDLNGRHSPHEMQFRIIRRICVVLREAVYT